MGNGGLSITDSAIEKNTESYVGSGSIFSFVSATESIGSNPPETTELFRFSGASTEKNTESYVGSGSIFTFVSFTETSVVSEVSSELFRFSGTAAESISPAPHIGSGLLFQYGQRVLLDPTGKVRFLSADESITAVPPSEINTLKISGTRIENASFAYSGSGSIFSFVSFTESTSVSEVSSELFRFSGSSTEKNTESYVGSGSIFSFVSATEASINVKVETQELFRITGTSEEAFGKGLYSGTGSIFSFVSSSEVTSVSETSQEIFKISGSAVIRKTEYYSGSGSIFTFDSSTIAIPIKYVGIDKLFKLFGSVDESFAKSTYDGQSHSYFVGASSDEKVNYDPPKPTQITII